MKKYQMILIGLILLLIGSRIYTQSQSSNVITAFIANESTLVSDVPAQLDQQIKAEQQVHLDQENALNLNNTNVIREDVTESLSSNDIKSYYAYMRDGTEVSIERFNQLSIDELKDFTGIGDVTAAAIVSYRNDCGGFNYYEELINVKGIGQKKLDKLLNRSFD